MLLHQQIPKNKKKIERNISMCMFLYRCFQQTHHIPRQNVKVLNLLLVFCVLYIGIRVILFSTLKQTRCLYT